MMHRYTQRNLIKSKQNQIVFTIFRLILNQTDASLVLNQSVHGKHNLISGRFNKISKRFICVHLARNLLDNEYGYSSLVDTKNKAQPHSFTF